MRRSGVLLSVSSLPSPYGIGTLGKSAYEFIDYLKDAGQSCWQMLPLNPAGMGDSPYSSWAIRAGSHYLIDLDMLSQEGLLYPDEYRYIHWGGDPEKVDYGIMYNERQKVLRKAFSRADRAAVKQYLEDNPWILEHALYMAVKESQGMKAWNEWDPQYRKPTPEKMREWARQYEDEVLYWTFLQMEFDRQYEKLKAYAQKQEIKLIGDIPFYVNYDSADVWAHQDLFQLEPDGSLEVVSGCPGQVWGNPLYNWPVHARDGYKWWMERIEKAARMYDILRLDHFIGFDQAYAIDKETLEGEYQPGPGMKLLRKIGRLGHEVIAEDLGDRTPSMERLLKQSGFDGMMVLEYAFNDRLQEKSLYIPYNVPKDSVAYAGTHDNDTITGWIRNLKPGDLEFARDFMHSYGNEEQLNWDMIRTLMATAASTVIVQAQDLKALDRRMNTPGQAWGNWTWRLLPGALDGENAAWVRKITDTYGRLPVKEEEEQEEKE